MSDREASPLQGIFEGAALARIVLQSSVCIITPFLGMLHFIMAVIQFQHS